MSPINPTQVGLWGKPTSTLDWCERNYEVSSSKNPFVVKSNFGTLLNECFHFLIFPETSRDKRISKGGFFLKKKDQKEGRGTQWLKIT